MRGTNRWLASGVTFLLALAAPVQAAETACTDGLDNDGDFKTDCADADCALDAACVVTVTRHFDVIRDVPSQPITSWRNIYLIDWPENIGLRDVGSSTAVGNRCVGDPGSAATPDGVIDSTDAICTLWTSREGTFFLSRFDAGTCQFSVQTATKGPSIAFGGLPFPILPGQSYVVAVSTGSFSSLPRTPGILAGSCDRPGPGSASRYRPRVAGPPTSRFTCRGTASRERPTRSFVASEASIGSTPTRTATRTPARRASSTAPARSRCSRGTTTPSRIPPPTIASSGGPSRAPR